MHRGDHASKEISQHCNAAYLLYASIELPVFEQIINCYSEPLQYTAYYCCLFGTSTWLPQCMCLATHRLHYDVGRIALASRSPLDNQAQASLHVWIMSESPLWRDLTKAMSIHLRRACSGRGLNPRLSAWQADTLAKSYSNSLLIAYFCCLFGTSTVPVVLIL